MSDLPILRPPRQTDPGELVIPGRPTRPEMRAAGASEADLDYDPYRAQEDACHGCDGPIVVGDTKNLTVERQEPA